MKLLVTQISCLFSFAVHSQVLLARDLINLGQNDEKYFTAFAINHEYKFHKKTSNAIDYYYGENVQNIIYGLARYSDNKILYMTLKSQDFQNLQEQLKSLGFTSQEMNIENVRGKLFNKAKVNFFLYSTFEDDKGGKKKVYLTSVFH